MAEIVEHPREGGKSAHMSNLTWLFRSFGEAGEEPFSDLQ